MIYGRILGNLVIEPIWLNQANLAENAMPMDADGCPPEKAGLAQRWHEPR